MHASILTSCSDVQTYMFTLLYLEDCQYTNVHLKGPLVCQYMYISISIDVRIIYVLCVCACARACACVCVFVCVCMCLCMRVCVGFYTCMFICLYVMFLEIRVSPERHTSNTIQ